DQFMLDYAALDPIAATYLGVPGHDEELPDFSPAGREAIAELVAGATRRMEATDSQDESETVAKELFLERNGIELELHDAALDVSSLNVLHSPVQEIRQAFDLMPIGTAADWAVIATRLTKVPAAVRGVQEALLHAAALGRVSALRQVRKVAEQCDTWSGSGSAESFFAGFVAGADMVAGVDDALRAELSAAADAAASAYAGLAEFLRTELAPLAPEKDAVGEQVYQLWSRYFTGARFDLREAYEWGWQEFRRLDAEMAEVAERIKPGGTIADAAAALDADERYRLRGRDQLRSWMQRLSDSALEALRGEHFDIPDEIMRLECMIAPSGGTVGAYYTGPTEDFSRPGQMWWSLPADREEFSTWREVTTVYHEGVPGHHLQIATAVYQAETLNRFQRQGGDTSGYCEGWALYAERLMRELGYLSDDGDLLGMLDAHLFRAARVIVDIGMHLELEIPSGTGFHEGQRWTPELGLEFMLTRTIGDEANLRDEIDRYLGWPGQAPSYKLGERVWLAAREDARSRHGSEFSLRKFHTNALRMGGMGLDLLRKRLAEL
ncbi:MAG: DUF885 domain-containing protein, partial [Sciscionella sp.]